MIRAAISAVLRGGASARWSGMPGLWRADFGDSALGRHAAVFVTGALVLFGARLAGGCTSGHMMNGIMHTSVSGYIFALGAFAAAIPTALFLYKRET